MRVLFLTLMMFLGYSTFGAEEEIRDPRTMDVDQILRYEKIIEESFYDGGINSLYHCLTEASFLEFTSSWKAIARSEEGSAKWSTKKFMATKLKPEFQIYSEKFALSISSFCQKILEIEADIRDTPSYMLNRPIWLIYDITPIFPRYTETPIADYKGSVLSIGGTLKERARFKKEGITPYILNIEEEGYPDMVGNIAKEEIYEKFGEKKFKLIVIRCVPFSAEDLEPSLHNSLKLLAPGGKLICSCNAKNEEHTRKALSQDGYLLNDIEFDGNLVKFEITRLDNDFIFARKYVFDEGNLRTSHFSKTKIALAVGGTAIAAILYFRNRR